MSYSDFKRKIDHDIQRYGLRYGQTVMNCLAEVWPDKNHQIVNTDLDCFYNDNKADRLLAYLEKVWHNNETQSSTQR